MFRAMVGWLVLALCGCSGTYTTKFLDANEIAPGKQFSGYVAPATKLFVETYETTTLVDKGKVVGSITDNQHPCVGIKTQKIAGHPDWQHPMLLTYKPGLFEAYKFGIGLTDEGGLKSINVESTPDQGNTLKNLGSAATSFAGLGVKLAENPACTDGLALVGLRPVSDQDLESK